MTETPARTIVLRSQAFARDWLVPWCAASSLALLILLLGTGLLLVVRRSAGAFQAPLSAWTLLLVGCLLATVIVATRSLWQNGAQAISVPCGIL